MAVPVTSSAAAPKKVASQSTPVSMEGVIDVSDYEFNTFVFSAPVKQILFPTGSPVNGNPIYLAENTQVMLEFQKSQKPIQLVAELENDTVLTLRVFPKKIPGISHAVNGARPKSATPSKKQVAAATENKTNASPRGEDIELLKQLMTTHQPPAGFEPVKLPPTVKFDKFSVIPMASWADGVSKRIHIFSLVAASGQTAVVAPPQFYRDGINAVMLDDDVVDETHTPQLFVVEEFADE